MIKWLAERKITKFLGGMNRALPKNYGGQAPFTEGQVRSTIKELGYSEEFEELGIAVFCSEENYQSLGLSEELRRKYQGYRDGIGEVRVSDPGSSGTGVGGDGGE